MPKGFKQASNNVNNESENTSRIFNEEPHHQSGNLRFGKGFSPSSTINNTDMNRVNTPPSHQSNQTSPEYTPHENMHNAPPQQQSYRPEYYNTQNKANNSFSVVSLIMLIAGLCGFAYSIFTIISEREGFFGLSYYTYTPPFEEHEIIILVLGAVCLMISIISGICLARKNKYI